jgi:hypothetical protein
VASGTFDGKSRGAPMWADGESSYIPRHAAVPRETETGETRQEGVPQGLSRPSGSCAQVATVWDVPGHDGTVHWLSPWDRPNIERLIPRLRRGVFAEHRLG